MSAPITSWKKINSWDTNLARIRIEYPTFVDFTLRELINQNIIKPIHDKMRGAGLSQKIIDATFLSTEKLQRPRRISYFVISNYNAETQTGEKFAVGLFIEEGRRAYVVEAPPPTDDRPNPHLKFTPKGSETEIFRKRVKIPRYVGKRFVRDIVNQRKPLIQELLVQRQKEWFDSMLLSASGTSLISF